jgi:hypothetical protein
MENIHGVNNLRQCMNLKTQAEMQCFFSGPNIKTYERSIILKFDRRFSDIFSFHFLGQARSTKVLSFLIFKIWKGP